MTWSEKYFKTKYFTYSKLHVSRLKGFHSVFCSLCVRPVDHFYKGMAFIHIDDACLDHAEAREDLPQRLFRRSGTSQLLFDGHDVVSTYVTPPTNNVRLNTMQS